MTTELQPAAPSVQIFPDGRMNVANAAAYLGLSVKSLACYRSQGRGPTFTKLGKLCFYHRDDLDAWIAANRATSTAEHKAKRSAMQ
jgi:hypothetical protein